MPVHYQWKEHNLHPLECPILPLEKKMQHGMAGLQFLLLFQFGL